jgi:amino acid permease
MALKGLFRKKTVHDIMKQVEQNESDGHNALGKHLTARDLTAFGIAAIVGAGIFSTIGKASADGGPAVILVLQLLRMQNLRLWYPFLDRHIRIRMWLSAKLLLGL